MTALIIISLLTIPLIYALIVNQHVRRIGHGIVKGGSGLLMVLVILGCIASGPIGWLILFIVLIETSKDSPSKQGLPAE